MTPPWADISVAKRGVKKIIFEKKFGVKLILLV